MPQPFQLPPEEIAKLQEARRMLHDILKVIDDTEYCGVDCQSYRQQAEQSATQIDRLLEKFAPLVHKQGMAQ